MPDPDDLIDITVPPMSDDPSWLARTRTLVLYLSHPRSWAELNSWREVKPAFLRQGLAWLEGRGQARSFMRDGQVHWVRIKPSTGPSDVETDDPVIPKAPKIPNIPGQGKLKKRPDRTKLKITTPDPALSSTIPADSDEA